MTPFEVFSQFARVAIVGAPRAGKTTLADTVKDRPVIHTDDFIMYEWSIQPGLLIDTCRQRGDRWILEGVQVARCLRKGLQCDAVIRLEADESNLTHGQAALAKGIRKVFGEWLLSDARLANYGGAVYTFVRTADGYAFDPSRSARNG